MDINGRNLDQKLVTDLIKQIKEKKEISLVSDNVVLDQIIRFLKSNSKILDEFIEGKKRAKTQILKHVRSELRRLFGSYNDDIKKRKKVFDIIKKIKNGNSDSVDESYIINLLKTHQSTKERIGFYDYLYSDIFKITGKPESIIDLGCGLNPFSYHYMGLDKVSYFASDISDFDLKIMKEYFNKNEDVNFLTYEIDLLKAKDENVFSKIKKHDIAFFFKVLEIIEQSKSHKISEKIIKEVPCKWIVVSFPTKTVSGKKMNYPRRGWFERMLERLKYKFEVLEYDNEIFYVIKK